MVPEDQSGRRVQPRDEQGGKRGKGVAIASLCSLDELSLVHVDTFGDGATFLSRSGSMSRESPEGFPNGQIECGQRLRSARTNRMVPTIVNTRKNPTVMAQ